MLPFLLYHGHSGIPQPGEDCVSAVEMAGVVARSGRIHQLVQYNYDYVKCFNFNGGIVSIY